MTMTITVFIYNQFGWYYMFVIMAMIIFSIFLMFSRFGKIKLGKEDDEPDFNFPAWFAMLFSAGMGIGLVFFTTAEPISHAFISTPIRRLGMDKQFLQSFQYPPLHW